MEPLLIKSDYLPRDFKAASLKAEAGKRSPYILNGVGVIPISGVLLNEDSFFSMFFGGATTYGQIRDTLKNFEDNKEVKAIMLDVNSPGGDAYGVSELAEYIAEINSKKPVHAYVAGQSASAAYWLTSAAGNITAHKTAFVGSIGTYAVIEQAENETYIVSEQSPRKIPDVKTEEGQAQLRTHMNETTRHFISDVAAYRKADPSKVENEFGRGDIVNAGAALSLGMIDAVGNFESAFRGLANSIKNNLLENNAGKSGKPATTGKKFLGAKMAKSKIKAEFVIVDGDAVGGDIPVQEVTVDVIKELFPEVAEALIEEGRGVETAEMQEVDEAAQAADMTDEKEKEVVSLARAKKINAAEMAKKLLAIKAEKLKAANELAARAADQPPVIDPATEPQKPQAGSLVVNTLKLLRGRK